MALLLVGDSDVMVEVFRAFGRLSNHLTSGRLVGLPEIGGYYEP